MCEFVKVTITVLVILDLNILSRGTHTGVKPSHRDSKIIPNLSVHGTRAVGGRNT
jgi:hypothetical protein